jgi:tetratricopeptide (TPR) repeat protein
MRVMTKVWDEEDNKFLKENYLLLSNQELAEKFGVSKKSIQGKLRRLGLHRANEDEKSDDAIDSSEVSEKTGNDSIFKRKRLNVKASQQPAMPRQKPVYVPRELTERRKRAIRELDSAMKIMASNNKKKASEEFDFIISTFSGEIDIVHKAKMYKDYINKVIPQAHPPVTAEDYYDLGIWNLNNNLASESIGYFRKALELDPEYLDARYNIACLECRSGNFEEAIDQLSVVLDANDMMAEVIINDEDFESMHENEQFIALMKDYLKE